GRLQPASGGEAEGVGGGAAEVVDEVLEPAALDEGVGEEQVAVVAERPLEGVAVDGLEGVDHRLGRGRSATGGVEGDADGPAQDGERVVGRLGGGGGGVD